MKLYGTGFGTRSDAAILMSLLMETDTMAQCYFQSTVAEFDMTHQENFNKELPSVSRREVMNIDC